MIQIKGKIIFNPEDRTNKHKAQSKWKRMAIVSINDDITDYYAWFINKRYNLSLNKPLRGPHISFINDSINDIKKGLLTESDNKAQKRWNYVANMWNGREINIVLNNDVRTDSKYWWLNIPEENRNVLHAIRLQLGLGRPHWGLHMSIGYANEKQIEHSKYIHNLIIKYGRDYE